MDFWSIVLIVVLLLYIFVDVHYFIRVIWAYVSARFLSKKIQLLESSVIYGICLPSDADFLMTHMNNSRFLREYDFARFDYFERTGLMKAIMSKGGNFPVSAITVRYRQPLWMFSPYKIVTTPVYWDNKTVYFDQRIVTVKDGVPRSIGYTKVAIVKADFEAIVKKLFPTVVKPSVPQDLQKWIDSNEISSNNMKKAQ